MTTTAIELNNRELRATIEALDTEIETWEKRLKLAESWAYSDSIAAEGKARWRAKLATAERHLRARYSARGKIIAAIAGKTRTPAAPRSLEGRVQ